MNRLDKQNGGDAPLPPGDDHFVVIARMSIWYVSTEMARHIEASIDSQPRPTWIRFVDLSGARVRIRSRDVESVAQSTADQRAAERAFFRRIRKERKTDRDWDVDD